jgi:hypothetical protein
MATFGRLTDFVNKGLDLNKSNVFFHVFSRKDVQEFIVFLNTNIQLFRGFDANAQLLEDIGGSYTAYTIRQKKKKGDPFDRVTLKDTGDFYRSFNVKVFDDEFLIDAYYLKGGEDLRGRWGDDLAGLTELSKEKLNNYVLPQIQIFVLSWLLDG